MPEYALLLAFIAVNGLAAHYVLHAGGGHVYGLAAEFLGTPVSSKSPSDLESIPTGASLVPVEASSTEVASRNNPDASSANGLTWLFLSTMIAMAGIALWRLLRLGRRAGRVRAASAATVTATSAVGLSEQLAAKRQQIRRILSRDFENSKTTDVQVRQLMSTNIIHIPPHTATTEVASIMAERRIRHLLVCASNRRLLGIISDRDIQQRAGTTAEQIMTREPLTVRSDNPVAPAITSMLSRGISCLPVVNEQNELCGILTTTDLLMSLQCTLPFLTGAASVPRIPGLVPPETLTIDGAGHPATGVM